MIICFIPRREKASKYEFLEIGGRKNWLEINKIVEITFSWQDLLVLFIK